MAQAKINLGNVKGADGAAGRTPLTSAGTALTGEGPVEGTVEGQDGDLYVNSETGDMYTMRDGAWVFLACLKGPAGEGGSGDGGGTIDEMTTVGGETPSVLDQQNGGDNRIHTMLAVSDDNKLYRVNFGWGRDTGTATAGDTELSWIQIGSIVICVVFWDWQAATSDNSVCSSLFTGLPKPSATKTQVVQIGPADLRADALSSGSNLTCPQAKAEYAPGSGIDNDKGTLRVYIENAGTKSNLYASSKMGPQSLIFAFDLSSDMNYI